MYDSLWIVLLLMSVLNQFTNIMKRWSNVDSSRSGFDFWGDLTKESYVADALWKALLLTPGLIEFTNAMKKWSKINSSRSDSNYWRGLTKVSYVFDSLWTCCSYIHS